MPQPHPIPSVFELSFPKSGAPSCSFSHSTVQHRTHLCLEPCDNLAFFSALLAIMLIPNRPGSLKAVTSAAVFSLLFIYFFTYVFPLRTHYASYDPFHSSSSSCDPDSALVLNASAKAAPPSTITVSVEVLISQAPVTVTATTATTPTSTATAIPEKIWYKLGPKGLSDDAQGWINTCLNKNPTYRHEFLTDATGDYYVTEYFSQSHDIVETYLQLSIPILKADLLRYLILYAEGGIWSDLDVSCEDPEIHSWIPQEYRRETGLVVGLEFDSQWEDDGQLHSQFASWTIMARPQSPHMWQVIEDIIADLQKMANENNVSISGITWDMIQEVVDLTGPKRMTWSIVKSLGNILGETIDDRNISQLHEPKLVGDVLIMPGNSFAASQSGYPEDQGPQLVTHHYAGTWKNDHGGEMA
jgi:alpha 1,6-mannosyltransferase